MKNSIIQFTIDEDIKRQLEKEAKEKGLSLSSYIRLIILERKR